MARYPRRRNNRRRRGGSKLSKIRRNTGAKSQSRQIAHLSRQVTQLTKESSQYAQWAVSVDGDDTGVDLIDGAFYSKCISCPAYWEAIFQTVSLAGSTAAATANKCKITGWDIQALFTPQDSRVSLTQRVIRCWVMKLRKETAADTLAQTVNMSTLGINANATANSNLIYRTEAGGGELTMVKWNPAAFNVLGYREFTLANIIEETAIPDENTSVTVSGDVMKRIRMKIPCASELKPASGTFAEMSEVELMPMDRYFLVFHVGGFAADGVENGVRVDANICVNTKVYV